MTLVEKDADWPTHEDCREHGIDLIVIKGVIDWERKYGRRPTDIIFGRKACVKLREYIALVPMMTREWFGTPTNQFMGLTFHRDWECEGVKIFGDL